MSVSQVLNRFIRKEDPSVTMKGDYIIPANDTWLAQKNWSNGTLDGKLWQNQTVNILSAVHDTWLPVGNISQAINLTILPNNIAALNFPTAEYQSFADIFALARMILSPDYYSTQVGCIHPISGTYDTLVRISFYSLLLFSFIFRRHTWLAVAASSTAMLYSATVAVHALALFTQFEWNSEIGYTRSGQQRGDPDLDHTYPILMASLVLTMPILNWSTNVRRSKAQIIVVAWSILIFVALVPVLLTVSQYANGQNFRHYSFNRGTALLLCPLSLIDSPGCAIEAQLTTEKYRNCQCVNFCGLLEPPTPMRTGTPMVPFILPQRQYDIAKHPEFFNWTTYPVQVMAVVVALFGAVSLLFNQFSFRETRHLVFRVLNLHPTVFRAMWSNFKAQRHIPKGSFTVSGFRDTRTGVRKWQYIFAKTMAMLFFLTGVALTLIAPFVIVLDVIEIELTQLTFPHSEDEDAVGAWGAWVGTTMVLGAGAILHYQDAWEALILRCSDKALQLVGLHEVEDNIQGEQKTLNDRTAIPIMDSVRFIAGDVGIHLQYSLRRNINSIKFAYTEFRQWVAAPLPHSRLCACKPCASDRALFCALRTSGDNASSYEYGHSIELHNTAMEILESHRTKFGACGCRFCHFAREQANPEELSCPCRYCFRSRAVEESKRNEIKRCGIVEADHEYKTFGLRILQMLDGRIDSLFEQQNMQVQTQCTGHVQLATLPLLKSRDSA